jgi:hypothetical protein
MLLKILYVELPLWPLHTTDSSCTGKEVYIQRSYKFGNSFIRGKVIHYVLLGLVVGLYV